MTHLDHERAQIGKDLIQSRRPPPRRPSKPDVDPGPDSLLRPFYFDPSWFFDFLSQTKNSPITEEAFSTTPFTPSLQTPILFLAGSAVTTGLFVGPLKMLHPVTLSSGPSPSWDDLTGQEADPLPMCLSTPKPGIRVCIFRTF